MDGAPPALPPLTRGRRWYGTVYLAALELQDYVRQMSGATIPIVTVAHDDGKTLLALILVNLAVMTVTHAIYAFANVRPGPSTKKGRRSIGANALSASSA